MIIMCMDPELVAGKTVITSLIHGDDVAVANHPFLVVRRATFEEYRADHTTAEADTSGWTHKRGWYYYEVLTD